MTAFSDNLYRAVILTSWDRRMSDCEMTWFLYSLGKTFDENRSLGFDVSTFARQAKHKAQSTKHLSSIKSNIRTIPNQ